MKALGFVLRDTKWKAGWESTMPSQAESSLVFYTPPSVAQAPVRLEHEMDNRTRQLPLGLSVQVRVAGGTWHSRNEGDAQGPVASLNKGA